MKFSVGFVRTCYWSRQCSSPHSFFRSFVDLWVKIGHRNKSTFSQLIPMQSSTISDIILNWSKVCSQIRCKWNMIFESHVEICNDKLQFQFEEFLSSLQLKIIIHCATDQPSITQFRISVLNFQFSDSQCSLFLGWWAAQWALSKNEKKIQL